MVVLRSLDALLEPTKDSGRTNFQRDEAGFTEWDENGFTSCFYPCVLQHSDWTLQRLHDTATNSQQLLPILKII
jgi:type I restriction enzyme M protein